MAASELGGALCFGLMTLFTAPAALLGLRFLASVAAAPLVPATFAALPSLVPPNELERANGVLSRAGTAGVLVGPAVAAIVLTTIGGRWVFLLNTVTFLVSAGLILSIRCRARAEISERRNPVAGFSFIRRHPVLGPVSLAYGMAFIGIGVSVPAEVAVATSFGGGPIGYAALVCLWGMGMIGGATVGQSLAARPHQVFVIATAASALAIGFFSVTAAPLFAIALSGMAVGGIGAGLWEVSQNCLIQRATPDGIRARVLAANEAVMHGGITAGLAASALVIGTTGGKGGFAAATITSSLAAAILFLRGSRLIARPEAFLGQSFGPAGPRATNARGPEPDELPPSHASSRPAPAAHGLLPARVATTA
jgi:predicted MFS family arabinose efflux permease